MINLENLNRQHTAIKEEVNFIENELRKGKLTLNVAETALHISKLAGLLKIHLLEEDRFLYPKLLNSPDNEIQFLSNQYIHEMGGIVDEYTAFKQKFNIGRKISENIEQFLLEAPVIIAALKARIEKEDHELYYLIRLKNL